ncbi:EspJ family T3SS effector ADP-ribosyltransferase [Escherichia albertii]|uniref:EspJ family T3SS effector ADP-ribosyltransferase n=1 Tax=Escherichia albertii TaxID=208962 RepID=UPI0021D45CD5|nr:EspJ family T3SS effector ADP-ribosyltransferase [Escherichia albertii]MCU7304119.1 EspJ family T3SS effector ADP-ribosyltransferase [Escherichia albertii]
MPGIRNCLSSIANTLNIRNASYSLIKIEQNGKLSNRKISLIDSPAKLLSYRNADLIKETYVTEKVLSKFKIKNDFIAVRIQSNQFTDLKNKTIQGHKETVAQVMDWYNLTINPYSHLPIGTLKRSSDIAKEESRNALNFMIMEKNTFNENVLNDNTNLQRKYCDTKNSSWVVTSVAELLDKGAKVYPDISCSLRLGEPFIVTIPETTKLNVEIYPLKKQI